MPNDSKARREHSSSESETDSDLSDSSCDDIEDLSMGELKKIISSYNTWEELIFDPTLMDGGVLFEGLPWLREAFRAVQAARGRTAGTAGAVAV